jgi:hypothetical protein
MNRRGCNDRAVWFITHFQPRTGLVHEILDRPGFAEPLPRPYLGRIARHSGGTPQVSAREFPPLGLIITN